MTLKGAFFIVLFVGVVIGTAWIRWRFSHGPIRRREDDAPRR